ncbi:acylating sulfoacetaldehyde dehydrogenase [Candidatus Ponderosibacter sp. Uisw_141_02]|uniref:acylating sulfoacetaldehyde dehydrogenase n=1 Tax=Candidatus Ponderosibacter sp. Uisw_141_02 TaxID=3231000 RepID=UPI003D52A587
MTDVTADIDAMIARARKAQQSYEANGSQERFDRAAEAAAWALMEPSRNAELAAFAVAETGLGKIADKITKNHRKTLGLLRDIHGKTSFGLIDDDAQSGVSEFLRPKGVVAAIVPSTNPLATPINNVVNALKTGNAIILAPSPKGAAPLAKLLEYVYAEFDRIGLDHDLVQMVPNPPSKEKTARLMQGVDMLVVTGSQSNVRSAYSSGTPALGVGMGNVVTIIDETADLDDAAGKIARSKCFDNATSCSSENAVIVVDAVYDAFLQAIARAGGMCLDQDQTNHLISTHWHEGHLNRNMLAKDIDAVLDTLGFADAAPKGTKFLVAPATAIGPDAPISGEKMALFLALYRASDFATAKEMAREIHAYQGRGHSLGLHSNDDDRARDLAMDMQACRIIVNQAHCFATGGSFDNGLPFSLSMGCGSWGGNSIDDNLNWTHFVNHVRIARPIASVEPTVDEMFADYFKASKQAGV